MTCNTRCNFRCSESHSGFSFGGCGITFTSSSTINIYGNLHQFPFQRQIALHFTCIYLDLHNLYWCLVYNLWEFISWRDWFTATLKKQGNIPIRDVWGMGIGRTNQHFPSRDGSYLYDLSWSTILISRFSLL